MYYILLSLSFNYNSYEAEICDRSGLNCIVLSLYTHEQLTE